MSGLFDWLFQRRGEKVAEQAVKDYFASSEFKTKLAAIVSDTPVVKFLQAMQARYIERAPGLTMKQAWEHARINLVDFLQGDKIEFGDPRYDWSASGARELADIDMSYWEAA